MLAVTAATLDTASGAPAGASRPTTAPALAAPAGQVTTTPPLVVKTPPPAPAPAAKPPSPTATPAARPFVYRYVPPLSPDEALTLIRACIDILTINDAPTLAARCRRVTEIIGSVSNYIAVLDQRYSTLASYKWHFIDRQKVEPGVDEDTFDARPVIPNVSAISFAADYGDVYLYWVCVHGAKGNATTFTLSRLVERDYPHRQICYLFFPTAIQKVVIKYEGRPRGPRDPRLTVFAGVAREQEYLKQTLWYLRYAHREAQQAVEKRPESSRHLEAACQNLRQAAARLIRFRTKRSY
ncbi:hypothetical protein AMJ85_02815 [candidate division BRC1 bacterium SM23_51]|nr:MAG: hypothetical protein AMJ85_02815 [candidate division BRC1 bacterium SM23_51]